MKRTKEIHKDGYDFHIQYFDNKTPLELINRDNCNNLIGVIFRPSPNSWLTEKDTTILLEPYMDYFITEIKKVIAENIDFYNNFDLEYYFNQKGVHMDRKGLSTFVIKSHMYLKIKLKKMN